MTQQQLALPLPPSDGSVPPPIEATQYKVTAELGRTGMRRWGGRVQEEFDPNLRGPQGMKRFDEMRRNDPDVGAILTAIEMACQSVEWNVEPGGDTTADQAAADFIDESMQDMSLSWRDMMADIFTMFPFGFDLEEIVYKMRNGAQPEPTLANPDPPAPSKYDDGKIGWRKLAIRHQETIEQWDFDEHGGLRGAWQQLPTGGRIYLPLNKCVLFTAKRDRGNPEGYSILRNAYKQYYIKTNIEEIEVIGAERDMTGIPWIRLPVGATEDDKEAALDIIEGIKWDDQAGVVLPTIGEGDHMKWEIGTVQSPGSPRIDTDKTIQRATIAIARSVLAQFLTLGSGRVGSYALSKDMKDLFQLALKGWLDRIEETINKYMVDRLLALNDFGKLTENPKIVHGRMGQRDIDKFITALDKLAGMGMPMVDEDWNFIRSELEMNELSDEQLAKAQEKESKKEALLMQRNLPTPVAPPNGAPVPGQPAPAANTKSDPGAGGKTNDDSKSSDKPSTTSEIEPVEPWYSKSFS